ncbi:putative cytokinetic ring protein SteA [Goodfellowiella coeruleoviolacea]|uniref:putative cytokinetic ring protein SteA n=1 Tax=Goodfellowiella coeruleoviolacea TaxID=334858 RepID=UPI0020A39D48|nr:putative cytokinetic ring protein SteA [Goodfellowiella coeruleoviolacea]
MKLTGLLRRPEQAPRPGVTGVARVGRRVDELLRRLRPGDIAVLDRIDLDLRTAEALVAAGVVAVVNAAPSISGRFPSLGPETLIGAGIPLVDGVGTACLRTIRDGSQLRVHQNVLYQGETEVAVGFEQNAETIADQLVAAKAGMSAQLEAFSADTIEFLRTERTLLLDGFGVPELYVSMRDRHVLVVTPGWGRVRELRRLRRYVREFRPVLIGVDTGANALLEARLRPDVVVGDPGSVHADTLRAAREVVVPAGLDGHAPGLSRIQELGIGAVTFPASANPEDLALLLADAHGASLVVTVGFQAGLREFLDRERAESNPSTFLTRLKVGNRLVDSQAVLALHRGRMSVGMVALLLVGALAVIGVAVACSGVGAVYAEHAVTVWTTVVTWFAELSRGLIS